MTDCENGIEGVSLKEQLSGRRYDIEHALGMYALGFCTLPAAGIYDKERLRALHTTIKDCHIYLIGYVPRITYIGATLSKEKLSLRYTVLGNEYTIHGEVPSDYELRTSDGRDYLVDKAGKEHWPRSTDIQRQLGKQSNSNEFDVKYIGKAYGKEGSRNAIDRLISHETLQRISLEGVPEGYTLTLLLLSIAPSAQLLTVINPFAVEQDDSTRIAAGIDKLYNTTEDERIALYEASLIRYFYPQYNKEFKNSFPSTDLGVLQGCYEKDFGAVVAEICHDDIPFLLKSDTVPAAAYHIARHELHKEQDRRVFFSM
ncbi:hypothetical protein JAK24_19930 [Stenotrophomonas maltophilia]|nr:hypothetical protein [Stenotrophomonas maltophilia]